MFKRFLAVLLVLTLVIGLAACGQEPATNVQESSTNEQEASTKEDTSAKEQESDDNWKIGIMTGTVVQNEEEFNAAQQMIEKYGEEHIITMTYPPKFMDEQETTIANIVGMAADPDVKAIVIVQAVPGTSAAIDKAREIRGDDLLFIVGTPGEDPAVIASKADVIFQTDDLGMGIAIPEQAKKLGAKKFVHYSFPRHMSYPLLAARRDLIKENCERLGIEYYDATAPDPTGDAGVPGAQQFILEDTPRLIEKYGKDTAFFATNCSLQVPLIQTVVEGGAIYPQPCCPSPYHAFPGALAIEVPDDKKGDIDYITEEIREKIAEKGATGRFSNWPLPVNMMFIRAGVAYAKAYIDGETNGKVDIEVVKAKFSEDAGVNVDVGTLDDGTNQFEHYFTVILDYVNY